MVLVGEEGFRNSSATPLDGRRLAEKVEKEDKEDEEEDDEEEDDPSNDNSTATDAGLQVNSPLASIHYLNVTWAELDAENVTLSGWVCALLCACFDLYLSLQIKDMCLEYGFPLDPELIPQNRLSRQFTA